MGRLKRSKVNFSIKTGFQIRLFLNIMLIVLASTVVTCAVFYFNADQEIGNSLKQFHITARNFLDYLGASVLYSALFGLLLGGFITLFFPHKFAGPIYRIERDLKGRVLDEGDLTTRFNLRNNDEYKTIADNLNSLLENFESVVSEMNSGSEDISRILAGKSGGDESDLGELRERFINKTKRYKVS